MLRIVNQQKADRPAKGQRLTEGQLKELARSAVKAIGITVAKAPERVKTFLQDYDLISMPTPTEKQLISSIMEAVAVQDQQFNHDLGKLMDEVLSNALGEEYDSFFDFGEVGREIGGGAAQGAAGGGIWGAALGVVGGGLNLANSAQQRKIQEDQASAMSYAGLMEWKTIKEENKIIAQTTSMKIAIALLIVAGLVGGIYLFKKKKGGSP